jgi:Holliday junction resolvasome RuvABC endonuclease subunit
LNPERVLALDVSTKTGYALVVSSDSGMKLENYGTISQIHQPDGNYPSNYVIWAYDCFNEILKIINSSNPDVLVIEETSKGSKNAMSQKILEFLHFLLAQYIKDNHIKSVYIMTEQWRREIGCQMSKEEKLRNKEVRTYKKKNKTIIAYDINGKRTGLIGRKHVNIRRVSEIFAGQLKEPLKRKSEDEADALGLSACYHFRKTSKNTKIEEVTLEDMLKLEINKV